MRILFTIPHYFSLEGGKHASMRGNLEARVLVLSRQLLALHQLFGGSRCMLHIADKTTVPAGQLLGNQVDVVVLTTRGRHLLDQLPVDSSLYEHVETDAEPSLLGYECHALMQERLGNYNYYCYLEDDLNPVDPLFFVKLAWFTGRAGNISVLLPNRYEVPLQTEYHKVYIDGDIRPDVTERFQNVKEKQAFKTRVMGMPLIFTRTLNPHSGCFFLNAAQMKHFAEQPWFLDRSTEFVGPLESAASLGVMRTFRVYKAARACAQFLEIQHSGGAFASLTRKRADVSPKQNTQGLDKS